MKAVLQRVNQATVSVDNKEVGSIKKGYLILLGIGENDTKEDADRLLAKITKLRLFPDQNNKTNLNINDVNGNLLIISQFTLYADCRKGNRPSFTQAANPHQAEELYNHFTTTAKTPFPNLATGIFGAYMQITSTNDGPFTLILES